MSSPIYDFFKLVLISLSDLILNGVHHSWRLSKTVVVKDLKFFLFDESSNYALDFSLMLLPMIQGLILQKCCYKEDPILISSCNYYKILFTILTKVIVLHIEVILIGVGHFSF